MNKRIVISILPSLLFNVLFAQVNNDEILIKKNIQDDLASKMFHCVPKVKNETYKLTYVGNAGFLINIGDKKILIDALFKGAPGNYELPQDIQQKLRRAQEPFDNVDLILVTHAHGDHVDFEMVRQHMTENPDAILASTEQLISAFKDFSERSVGFNPEMGSSEEKNINGINVETFYLPHGPDSRIINIGFMIKVNGITLFQTGDVDFDQFTFDEFRDLGLPERNIDLSLIQHFYLTDDSINRKFVQEAIGGKYIIPIHYHFTTPAFDSNIVRQNYPDAIIFEEELDTWQIPVKENESTELSGDYLGQPLPGLMPVVFAPGIISVDSTIEHGYPAFSPDGNTVLWQSNLRHKDRKTDIYLYRMRRVKGRWTAPEISPFGGMPAFSPDGMKVFFLPFDTENEKGLFFSEKQGERWSEPESLNLISSYPELKYIYGPSITNNGTLYFFAHSEGLGSLNNFGIYRSEFINGEYAEPELLPQSMNVGEGVLNWTPFIAPDESYLLFSSSRKTSDNDFGDIYVCFRKPDGSWSEALNLGDQVNTDKQERFPCVSPDGKYLFFTRWVSPGNEDVFWLSASIINNLRSKALSGYLYDDN